MLKQLVLLTTNQLSTAVKCNFILVRHILLRYYFGLRCQNLNSDCHEEFQRQLFVLCSLNLCYRV